MINELIEQRQENSKTFRLDDGKEQLRVSIGAIHYKGNYATDKDWLDIDLIWEGNKITKAPYELTLEGNKLTIRNKKSGEVSTIELLDIGGKGIHNKAWEKSKGLARASGITTLENVALDTDLEIVAENSRVKFVRILKSDKAPVEAKFKVTGNFIVRAQDEDGELPIETIQKDGILTETLKPDRAIKYPVRIDPTWQVGALLDDGSCWWTGAAWSFLHTISGLPVGYIDANSLKFGNGMRFLNVTIPQGTTITTAYLIITARDATADVVVNSRITGEDVDDAAIFDDTADYQARRGTVVGGANDDYITTAQVDWDAIPAWSVDEEGADTTSPEIKTIIQEQVDRALWASGNALVLFWDDHDARGDQEANHYRSGYSYNGSTTKCAQLVITYPVKVPIFMNAYRRLREN